MDKKQMRRILSDFQTPRVMRSEELFAKLFTQENNLRVFFINESTAATDGRNIYLNPSVSNLFVDERALKACELYLGLPEGCLTQSSFMALKMITRGLNIHESLHLLYTSFPPTFTESKVPKNSTERDTLREIENIIEDAYIEAVGSSVYDNLGLFLMLIRVGIFYSDESAKSRSKRKNQHFKGAKNEPINSGKFLLGYLNYFVDYLLYPFAANLEVPEQIKEYVEKTRDLFIQGAKAPTPQLRLEYSERILEAIRPLIPEEEELDFSSLDGKILDRQTHGGNSISSKTVKRKGKKQEVDKSLFEDGDSGQDGGDESEEGNQSGKDQKNQDGNQGAGGSKGKDGSEDGEENGQSGQSDWSTQQARNRAKQVEDILNSPQGGKKEKDFRDKSENRINDKIQDIILDFEEEEMDNQYDKENKQTQNQPPQDQVETILPTSLDAPESHSKIKIKQRRYVADLSLQDEYNKIRNKNRHVISLYKKRFAEILRADVDYQENRYLFGSGINSKYLSDPDKRYWYRTKTDTEVPELSILLIIDGSGSMYGEPRKNCRDSCIILHEVLKSQGVKHAVVEHRAEPYEEEININLLLGFDAPDRDKYNLMRMDAYGENRDGLALLWGEKYLSRLASTENKLIIILSDGLPAHNVDNYYPPSSVEDTKGIVKRIKRRGTNVIGIALDHGLSSGSKENLLEIYPDLVTNNDLKALPTQLLKIISKELI